MPVWYRVVPMALRIQPLVVRAVGIQRVGIDTTLAGRNRLATDRLNHRVALGVHDDPGDLISSLIRAGGPGACLPPLRQRAKTLWVLLKFRSQVSFQLVDGGAYAALASVEEDSWLDSPFAKHRKHIIERVI